MPHLWVGRRSCEKTHKLTAALDKLVSVTSLLRPIRVDEARSPCGGMHAARRDHDGDRYHAACAHLWLHSDTMLYANAMRHGDTVSLRGATAS